MKERIIKIKLSRDRRDKSWKIKSIVGAIKLDGPYDNESYKPGDPVADSVAQMWVDAYRTYEVTCTE